MLKNGHIKLEAVPGPAERRMAVRVTAAAERAIRQGHPWLFEGAIQHLSHHGRCGDLAVVFDHKRQFLAIGLYDPYSPIRVRLLHQGQPTPITRQWFQQKIALAAQKRATLVQSNTTTGYRVVHGENDGLPGLIVDQYAYTCVIKLYTAAWIPHLSEVLAAVLAVCQVQQVVLRLSRAVAQQPAACYGLVDGDVLAGDMTASVVSFQENGLLFEADVIQGQKTGFFLDQRENRARVEKLAQGKMVLNVFAYTGGFSLYAARGGARQVVSLDISQPALETAVHHFALNQAQPAVAAAEHEIAVGDVFQVLPAIRRQQRQFDVVVIDPPAFAKKQAEVERALAAYGRLVGLGLGVLRPGGILVMASCSSRVGTAVFYETVHQMARQQQRPLTEIERTGHPLDHPIGFAEGAYLKCLFALAP